jgi:hypothetical protein
MASALKCMPSGIRGRDITIMTSNRSAGQVVWRPRQQSGQCTLKQIYDHTERLRKQFCSVSLVCVPASEKDFALRPRAKAAAQEAARAKHAPESPPYQARSTKMRLAMLEKRRDMVLPEKVGRYSKRIDTALPGKHTRGLYDQFQRRESDVLIQLRTGMSRLNGYLHKIGAAESAKCECGHAAETVEHYLFRCKRWKEERQIMLQYSRTEMGNLSFFLGGKAASNGDKSTPNIEAVKASVKFAIATRRLERMNGRETNTTSWTTSSAA